MKLLTIYSKCRTADLMEYNRKSSINTVFYLYDISSAVCFLLLEYCTQKFCRVYKPAALKLMRNRPIKCDMYV